MTMEGTTFSNMEKHFETLPGVSLQLSIPEQACQTGATRRQFGTWETWVAPRSGRSWSSASLDPVGWLAELRESSYHVMRFMVDVFAISPMLFVAVFALQAADAFVPAMQNYATNQLLFMIESGVLAGNLEIAHLRLLLVREFALGIATIFLRSLAHRTRAKMVDKVRLYFEQKHLEASLSYELDTFDHNREGSRFSHAWDGGTIFVQVANVASSLLYVLCQASVVQRIAMEGHIGYAFLVVWLVRLLPVEHDRMAQFFTRGCIYFMINAARRRMDTYKNMVSSKELREDIVSGDLRHFVRSGFKKARTELGDASTGTFHEVIGDLKFGSPTRMWLEETMDNLPILLYALHAASGQTPFQLSTITSLQRGCAGVNGHLKWLLGSSGVMPVTLRSIKELYAALALEPDLSSDGVAYPGSSCKEKGMEIVLKSVSYKYPTSQTSRPAVKDLTCTFGAGKIIVIVGANGSGKTSLVKLLAQLHFPSSGDILIDGVPAGSYRRQDLRHAIAILSQDHHLFPLSIRENIAVGRPYGEASQVQIQRAARMGGAHEFISRFTDDYETTLTPLDTKVRYGLSGTQPLRKVYDEVEKETKISGGERQRLVAARTFMRISDEKIRLVIVDEPSAAMDPAGEYELFKHLREAREGRTMVFITHRFGHLTKHADVIMCMKDGELVESGTHIELIEKKGEYCALYDIQAQAFT